MKQYFGLLVLPFVLTGCVVQTPTSDEVLTSLQTLAIEQVEIIGEEAQKELQKNQEQTQDLTITFNQKGMPFIPSFNGTLVSNSSTTLIPNSNAAKANTTIDVNATVEDMGDIKANLDVDYVIKDNKAFLHMKAMNVEAPMLPEAITPTEPVINTWYEISEETIKELALSFGASEDDLDEELQEVFNSMFEVDSSKYMVEMTNILTKAINNIETTGEITEEDGLWMVPAKLSAESMMQVSKDVLVMMEAPEEDIEDISLEEFTDLNLVLGVKPQNIIEKTLGAPYFVKTLEASSTDQFSNVTKVSAKNLDDEFTLKIENNDTSVLGFFINKKEKEFLLLGGDEAKTAMKGTYTHDSAKGTFYDGEEEEKEVGTFFFDLDEDKIDGSIVALGDENTPQTDITFMMAMPDDYTFNMDMNVSQANIFEIDVDYNTNVETRGITDTISNQEIPNPKSLVELSEAVQNDPSLAVFMQPQTGNIDVSDELEFELDREEEEANFKTWVEGMSEEEAQETFGVSKAEVLESLE